MQLFIKLTLLYSIKEKTFQIMIPQERLRHPQKTFDVSLILLTHDMLNYKPQVLHVTCLFNWMIYLDRVNISLGLIM